MHQLNSLNLESKSIGDFLGHTTTLQTSPSSSYREFTGSLGWEAERKEGKKRRGGKGKGAYARTQEEEDARIESEWSTSVRGNNARDWHESCNPSSQGNTPPLLLLLAIAPPLFYHKAPSPKLLTRAFPSLNSKALNPNLLLGRVVETRMKKFKPNSFWRQIRSNKTLKCKLNFSTNFDGKLSFILSFLFPELLLISECCYIYFHCSYLYNNYSYSRTLCIKCRVSTFHTEI